jgi:hypothetical protein
VVAAVHRHLSTAALAANVSSTPTGISVSEAEAILGGPPDDQAAVRGVVASKANFIAAGLPRASAYGEHESYRMFLWKRDRETVVVVSDLEGHVVCRFLAIRPKSDLLQRLKSIVGLGP